MEKFRASVQYGDWEGTAAADNAHVSFSSFLRQKGTLKDGELLVGVRVFVGENLDENPQVPWIRAVISNGNGFDNVKSQIENSPELILSERDVALSLNEFFSLFKRFSVVLTSKGLGLDGREYKVIED